MIIREKYLAKLRLLKDKNLIKVITGIRRSGKSTLLEVFRKELLNSGMSAERIIFINFEERESADLGSWTEIHDFILSQINPQFKNYIFLDEVQLVPKFERLVNSLFSKKYIDLYI